MKIIWDNDRLKWLIYDNDITDHEWRVLSRGNTLPNYHDNTEKGDVYYYPSGKDFGALAHICLKNNIQLEIITRPDQENENSL